MSDKDDPTIFEMFQAAPPGSVLLVQRVMLEDMQQTMDALRAQVEFWRKRTEVEGEATLNAVEAAEALRAEVERLKGALGTMGTNYYGGELVLLKAENEQLRALLAERHLFPDYPGPGEGQVSTVETITEQEAWTEKWNALDDRIQAALARSTIRGSD